MSDDATRSEQNPALFRHPAGELWLLYTAQEKADQGTSVVRIRRSADEGRTWSEVRDLIPRPGTFIRHAPVVNPDGLLLLPVWHSDMRNAFGDDSSLVQVSADGGRSWETVAVPGSSATAGRAGVMATGATARGATASIRAPSTRRGAAAWANCNCRKTNPVRPSCPARSTPHSVKP